MTIAAVLFMSLSVVSVTALAAWCYYMVLKRPAEEDDPPE